MQDNDIHGISGFADEYACRRFGNSYACEKVSEALADETSVPIEHKTFSIFFVQRGRLKLTMASGTFIASPNSIIVVPPGMLAKISKSSRLRNDIFALHFSVPFMTEINLDPNAFAMALRRNIDNPIMQLSAAHMGRLHKFYGILEQNAAGDPENVFARNIARSVCAGLIYQIMDFATEDIDTGRQTKGGESVGLTALAHSFVKLVHNHFRTERNVSFYANRLCVSERHLTQTVRQVTGRTPGRWVSDMVIIEAKNLLRFSGKNIQQIAYTLNFANQSAFGHYFKHHTGQSPTAFQNH